MIVRNSKTSVLSRIIRLHIQVLCLLISACEELAPNSIAKLVASKPESRLIEKRFCASPRAMVLATVSVWYSSQSALLRAVQRRRATTL